MDARKLEAALWQLSGYDDNLTLAQVRADVATRVAADDVKREQRLWNQPLGYHWVTGNGLRFVVRRAAKVLLGEGDRP